MSAQIPSGTMVLVATDGSITAEAAVDWAATRAAALEANLLILTVVAAPSSAELRDSAAEFGGSAAQTRQFHRAERHEKRAQDLLDRAAARVAIDHPDLWVFTRIFAGSRQEALRTYSSKASLTVIGSRGLGTVRSSLLGSLGLWAARHLHTPLAIVRSADHARHVNPDEVAVVAGLDDAALSSLIEHAHGVVVVAPSGQPALLDAVLSH